MEQLPADWLQNLATLVDPAEAFKRWTGGCDDWQAETLNALLFEREPFLILYCARQVGKSSVLAAGAYTLAEMMPKTLVVIAAPAERQAKEVYLKLRDHRVSLGASYDADKSTESEMILRNGSRILIVTVNEKTSRGISQIDVLLLDEAARIADTDIQALIPALRDTGSLCLASTPASRNGFFYEAIKERRGRIITVKSTSLPRRAAAVARDRAIMSAAQFKTEHELEWIGGSAYSLFDMDLIAREAFCDRPSLHF